MIVCLGIPLACQTANFINEHRTTHLYLGLGTKSTELLSMQAYASFYLLNNSYIPLDLVVLIDTAKLLYTLYLESDVSTYGM